MREKSKRVQRVSELIQSVIAMMLLREVSDPRLSQVTITGVNLAPDYGNAVIYFTLPDTDEKRIRDTEQAFQKAIGFFRRQLAQLTELRHTPRLTFKYDVVTTTAERIACLLNESA